MLRAASGFVLTLFTPQADSLTRCVHVWLHTVKKKMKMPLKVREQNITFFCSTKQKKWARSSWNECSSLSRDSRLNAINILTAAEQTHNDNVMFFTAKTNQNAARENYRSSQAIYNEAIVFWSAWWNQTSTSTEDTDTDGQILYLECRLGSLDVC